MYLHRRSSNQAQGIGPPLSLGQSPNPDHMPTNPLPPGITPPVPMPTNPVVPKPWCSQLSKIENKICFAYAPTEIATSRTEAGHLAPDVVLVQPGLIPQNTFVACRFLIIRDFGVDWRHVKRAATSEPLFQTTLARFEVDKTATFRIVGYSDCVGIERNNVVLRRGRARNVFRLFGSSARSRVLAVTAAPSGTYLVENSTVAGRANNRAVVVEIFEKSLTTT